MNNVHNPEKNKAIKPRRPRKDKGIKKVSMASALSGVKLSLQANLQVIEDTNNMSKNELNLNQADLIIEEVTNK